MLYPDLESEFQPELTSFNILLVEESKKLPLYKINVTNHCKTETSLDTFIEYTLVTEIDGVTYTVRRRYRDFDWLMTHLYQKYPLYILPPIPPKRIFTTTDKFSRSFIDKRKQDLERMLNRLSYFKICLEDKRTQIFLKFNQKEFDQYRKEYKNMSLIEKVTISIKQIYDDTVCAFNGENSCATKDESTMQSFQILYKRITERTILGSIIKSMDDMSFEWEKLSFILLWNAQNIADIVLLSNKSGITNVLDGVAQFFFNWSTETKLQRSNLSTISPLIYEYIAYNNEIIDLMRNRNNMKISLGMKKKAIFSLQAQLSSDKYNSLPRGSKYDQLMTESIKIEDYLTDFDRIFFPSYSDWQFQRSCDMAKCFSVIVKTNINYHKSCLDICKNLLNKILDNQF